MMGAALIAAALSAGGGAPAVIAAPVNIVAEYRSVASSSEAYTTTGAVPPNSLIRVSTLGLSSVGATAVSDPVNGTYTAGNTVSASFQRRTHWVFCAAGLAAGSTITVTWNSAGSSIKMVRVDYVTGIRSASPRDQGGGAGTEANPSTTPSITTAVLGHANSIVFMDLTVSAGASDGFTQDANGWAALTSVSGGTHILRGAYKIVAATTAETYAPVLAVSRFWTLNQEVFKGT